MYDHRLILLWEVDIVSLRLVVELLYCLSLIGCTLLYCFGQLVVLHCTVYDWLVVWIGCTLLYCFGQLVVLHCTVYDWLVVWIGCTLLYCCVAQHCVVCTNAVSSACCACNGAEIVDGDEAHKHVTVVTWCVILSVVLELFSPVPESPAIDIGTCSSVLWSISFSLW